MRFVRVTAAVIVVFVVVALVAQAAFAAPAAPVPAAPPADGGWMVSFTPTAVRTVGKSVGRDAGLDCETNCQAAYKYEKAGTDVGPTQFFLTVRGEGCGAPPCEMPVGTADGNALTGTARWDGTRYTVRGKGARGDGCGDLPLPAEDTLDFTVGEDGTSLTGTASLLLSWVAETDSERDTCIRYLGWEIYDGTIASTRRPPLGGAGSGVPGGAGGGASSTAGSAVAGAAHDRPVLSRAVADARSLPWGPSRIAVSAFLALLLVLLMPFPAALFNSTLEANHDEVRGWFSFVPRRDPDRPRPVARDFALVVVVAAVLNAFLDPGLGFDRASALLLAGLALSIAAVSLLAVQPSRLLRGERASVRVYPLGLVVAAVCVLVSRLTSFEPGYLYGVVAGFAFARPLRREEAGRLSFVTAAFLLGVAVVAFVVRIPVHEAAADGSVPLVLADTVLAALFAAGVEANVLGLLPLRFLAGESLMAWRRWAWAAAFGLSLFAFLHALSARAGEDSTAASVTVAAVLFGTFATVSVTFWAYFRYRPSDPTPASV